MFFVNFWLWMLKNLLSYGVLTPLYILDFHYHLKVYLVFSVHRPAENRQSDDSNTFPVGPVRRSCSSRNDGRPHARLWLAHEDYCKAAGRNSQWHLAMLQLLPKYIRLPWQSASNVEIRKCPSRWRCTSHHRVICTLQSSSCLKVILLSILVSQGRLSSRGQFCSVTKSSWNESGKNLGYLILWMLVRFMRNARNKYYFSKKNRALYFPILRNGLQKVNFSFGAKPFCFFFLKKKRFFWKDALRRHAFVFCPNLFLKIGDPRKSV